MAGPEKECPVKNNDKIELVISGMNHQGEGVGKYQGFTVFVPFVLPGDRIVAEIGEVKRSYARGKALQVLSRSPDFVPGNCSIYGKCGGCCLQHFDYSEQLRYKQKVVENALQRIGKLQGIKVLPVIGMEYPFCYRNKAEYPVRLVDGRFASGFFASKSSRLVPLEETCPVQHPLLEKARKAFIGICNGPDFRKKFAETGFHQLVVRAGVNTREVMVIAAVDAPVPGTEGFFERLTTEVPEATSFYQKVTKSRGRAKSRNKPKTEYKLAAGKSVIRERLGNLDFDISPGSFFQVNSAQAEVLFAKVLEYAGCKGVAVDAYCGTGSISLFLAGEAQKVYGFEAYPDAVKDARHNAAINGIENTEFIPGDVADTLGTLHDAEPETVVIDPPRAGCDEKALEGIIRLNPRKIVYVSCNPSTLARDLKILTGRGYNVAEVQPVDMFPQAYHVETVVLITRAKE